MASSQGESSLLSETLTMMKRLNEQNSEMNRLLELIEEKRNGAKVKDVSKETDQMSDRELNRQPKGILKAPKLGDKNSYGFIEKFELTENNRKYGEELHRTLVPMNQDNRLCLRYGFEPNIGCQYPKSSPVESEKPTMPRDELTSQSQGAVPKSTHDKGSLSNCALIWSLNDSTSETEHLKPDTKQESEHDEDGLSSQQNEKQMTEPNEHTIETSSEMVPDYKMFLDEAMKQLKSNLDDMDVIDDFNLLDTMLPVAEKLPEYIEERMRQLKSEGVDVEDGDNLNPKDVVIPVIKKALGDFMNRLEESIDDTSNEETTIVIKADDANVEDRKRPTDENIPKMTKENRQKVDESFVLAMENRRKEEERLEKDEENRRKANKRVDKVREKRQKTAKRSETAKKRVETNEDNGQKAEITEEKRILTVASGSDNAKDRTTNNDNNDDDGNKDNNKIMVDPGVWKRYAEKEIEHGKYCKDIREKGMDTIFCLDVSSSMKGVAWEQAMEFIRKFLEGIQTTNLLNSVYEHVALVTFGSKTCVKQHLTCDYLEVNRKLDSLKPDGPSPLYAGLQMCQAAILGAGSIFSRGGYDIYPRIFLITDGKVTEACLSDGPDEYTGLEALEEQLILGEVGTLSEKFHTVVNPVPVGSFELPILEKIASNSKGKLINPNDWEQQSRAFMNYLVVCSIDKSLLLGSGLYSYTLDYVLPSTGEADKAQMLEFLETHEPQSRKKDREIGGLPPLGSRVRHQTNDKLGTVVNHISEDQVNVTWDSGEDESLNVRLLRVVKEPRILYDELIAVGCRVERGKDWRYGEQDGGPGNYGNIYEVSPNGIVKIRWDCGGTNTYRYGAEGLFDVKLVEGSEIATVNTKRDDVDEIKTEDAAEIWRIEQMNKRNELLAHKNDELEMAETADVTLDNIGATGYTMPRENFIKSTRRMTDGAETDKQDRGAKITEKHGPDVRMAKTHSGGQDPRIADRHGSAGSIIADRHVSASLRIADRHGAEVRITDVHRGDPRIADTHSGDQDRHVSESSRIAGADVRITSIQSGDPRITDTQSKSDVKMTDTRNRGTNMNGDNGKEVEMSQEIDYKKTSAMQHVASTYTKRSSAARSIVQWMYKDENGCWILYPDDVIDKIESSFIKHSSGTCVIQLDDTQYRIAFSKMQQINVSTREKIDVKRISKT